MAEGRFVTIIRNWWNLKTFNQSKVSMILGDIENIKIKKSNKYKTYTIEYYDYN